MLLPLTNLGSFCCCRNLCTLRQIQKVCPGALSKWNGSNGQSRDAQKYMGFEYHKRTRRQRRGKVNVPDRGAIRCNQSRPPLTQRGLLSSTSGSGEAHRSPIWTKGGGDDPPQSFRRRCLPALSVVLRTFGHVSMLVLHQLA